MNANKIRTKERTRTRRRARGSGAVYQRHGRGCDRADRCGCPWWISYTSPAGKREAEPGGTRKGDAERLLQRRTGAAANNLPVIPRAERLTFDEAARDVINDYAANGKRSLVVAKRRIGKHLTPVFGGRRLAGITAADVRAYVSKRQQDAIVVRKARTVRQDDGTEYTIPAVTKPVSNAEINRELQTLRRIFNLAIASGRLATKPHIALLRESPARSGFFDRAQVDAVQAHLPAALRPVIEFAFVTGWRLHSEILPLEWRQVDFAAGEVRLLAGQTKNGQPRTFPMTADLRRLLESQKTEHDRLKRQGHIVPFVFFREVAKGRGGEKQPRPIVSLGKAWKLACRLAGCPGRIPHDLRRSAVRTFVRAGLSEHVAMKLSGHLTPSVFRRYDIVSEADLRDA